MKRELVAGINAVEGLLTAAPETVTRVWLRTDSPRLKQLGEQVRAAGIAVQNADDRALDRLSDGVHHQGVVAEIVPRPPLTLEALMDRMPTAGRDALLLVLDGVQDPHNLGACLRCAAAAGAMAVMVPRARAVGLTPAVRRAAAGAAERVPLVVVGNLVAALRTLAESGVWLVGLAGEAADSLYQTDLRGPLALVLGGEERGLRRLTRETCDTLARIPMPGDMESLNVSVASGIALFEALRQRAGTPL